MAKPFIFADDPCALVRIDVQAVVIKMLEDFRNFAGIIIPASVKDANIIKKMVGGCV